MWGQFSGRMAGMTDVFKLQRPLGGNMSLALAYDRARKQQAQVPYDAALEGLFASHGNPLKLYVLADLRDGALNIASVVPPQHW